MNNTPEVFSADTPTDPETDAAREAAEVAESAERLAAEWALLNTQRPAPIVPRLFFGGDPVAFYDNQVHATIPAGAVEISRARHEALLAGQRQGRRIVADVDGQPILAPVAVPTDDDLANAARAKRNALLDDVYDPGVKAAERAKRLARTPEAKAAADAELAKLDTWAEKLLAVTEQDGFPKTIVWPKL